MYNFLSIPMRGGTAVVYVISVKFFSSAACRVFLVCGGRSREKHTCRGGQRIIYLSCLFVMGLRRERTGAALAHLLYVFYMYTYISLDGCVSV